MIHRVSIAIWFLLFVGVVASAQTDGLVIEGDTVLVVKTLPFKIKAPVYTSLDKNKEKPFVDYTWLHPSSVSSEENDDGSILTIKSAPSGEITVKVKIIVQEEGKRSVRKVYQITFVVGALPIPPPPNPVPPGPLPPPVPPPPDNELAKAIATALTTDKDTDKVVLAKKLGAIYRVAATTTAMDSGLKTVKDIDAVIRTTTEESIGVLTIPNTRDAIGKWLVTQLPTKKDTVLTDADRQKMKSSYLTLADVLEVSKDKKGDKK